MYFTVFICDMLLRYALFPCFLVPMILSLREEKKEKKKERVPLLRREIDQSNE